MASISDYASLKTAIAEWLWRSSDTALTGRGDAFIQLFEAGFTGNPENRFAEMEETDTAVINDVALPLPDGFLEMRDEPKVIGAALNIADQPLGYVTPKRAAILDSSTLTTGTCKNYTVKAEQIFFAPKAIAPIGATLELTYYKFTPLSDTNTTNWLLSKYPNIYLFGSLVEAADYIDDKDTVAAWQARLNGALAGLPVANRKRKSSSGPLVITPSTGFRT